MDCTDPLKLVLGRGRWLDEEVIDVIVIDDVCDKRGRRLLLDTLIYLWRDILLIANHLVIVQGLSHHLST